MLVVKERVCEAEGEAVLRLRDEVPEADAVADEVEDADDAVPDTEEVSDRLLVPETEVDIDGVAVLILTEGDAVGEAVAEGLDETDGVRVSDNVPVVMVWETVPVLPVTESVGVGDSVADALLVGDGVTVEGVRKALLVPDKVRDDVGVSEMLRDEDSLCVCVAVADSVGVGELEKDGSPEEVSDKVLAVADKVMVGGGVIVRVKVPV
eukprot:gene4506-biopygen4200